MAVWYESLVDLAWQLALANPTHLVQTRKAAKDQGKNK